MRLFALLLVGALLLLPTAAAAPSAKVSINGAPNAATDLTTNSTATIALSVHLKLSGFTCPQDSTAKVTLTVNSTGNATGKLDKTTLTYTVPGLSPDTLTGVGSDYDHDAGFNVTLTRSAAGWGNVTVAAAFDGKMLDGCQANPDPLGGGSGDFGPSQANATLVTAYFGPTVVTPTATPTVTPTGTPTGTTPAGTTPATVTPTDTTPVASPTPEDSGGHKLLPAPGVLSLVAAIGVAALIVFRRKA